jgi:hypothetical protein
VRALLLLRLLSLKLEAADTGHDTEEITLSCQSEVSVGVVPGTWPIGIR